PFHSVEGWSFVQTLGEGTYGEVKLVVKNGMGMTEAVAVKIVDLKKAKLSLNLIKKEIAIHKMLHHENVIKFYGTRKEADYQDIKPENILLDDKDVLKIVDFGFATLFRHKGKERLVDNSCGTPPYVAPEVMLDKPYHAEPADIWSCAIVLVAMLAGELPWDSPNLDCDEFVNWLEHNIQFSPWTKIGTMPLALLRKLLAESPRDRYSIAAIKKDRWFMKQLQQKRRLSSPVSSPFTKRAIDHFFSQFSASQPEPWLVDADVSEESVGNLLHIGLSQPAESTTMLISTQCLSTPCSSQTALQRLVKRMTRFWSCKNTFNTMTEIKEVCGKLDYSVKQTSSMELTVTTKDRRLRRLVFKVFFYPGACEIGNVKTTTHRTLVDVRMSQGDGLEFKRRYDELNKRLANLVLGQTLTGSI
uniref:non-specific serine/threonine protein kinase n=1 Tax=Ciona savignyi TaxID=51511 RepID=H2Y7A7_CIOSA